MHQQKNRTYAPRSSRDLNTGQVWYSGGEKSSDRQIALLSTLIWMPETVQVLDYLWTRIQQYPSPEFERHMNSVNHVIWQSYNTTWISDLKHQFFGWFNHSSSRYKRTVFGCHFGLCPLSDGQVQDSNDIQNPNYTTIWKLLTIWIMDSSGFQIPDVIFYINLSIEH